MNILTLPPNCPIFSINIFPEYLIEYTKSDLRSNVNIFLRIFTLARSLEDKCHISANPPPLWYLCILTSTHSATVDARARIDDMRTDHTNLLTWQAEPARLQRAAPTPAHTSLKRSCWRGIVLRLRSPGFWRSGAPDPTGATKRELRRRPHSSN